VFASESQKKRAAPGESGGAPRQELTYSFEMNVSSSDCSYTIPRGALFTEPRGGTGFKEKEGLTKRFIPYN
jgi:hypothetical protein